MRINIKWMLIIGAGAILSVIAFKKLGFSPIWLFAIGYVMGVIRVIFDDEN